MADLPTLAVLGAGGAAIAFSLKEAKDGPAPTAKPGAVAYTSGGRRMFRVAHLSPVVAGRYSTRPLSSTDTRYHQSHIREAEKRAKEEYNRLSSEAKRRGAAAVNAELGTNLTGDESFEEASAMIGAAVGGAAAAAGCAAIGAAAVASQCAVLGAIAGNYLGKKLGAWLDETWDDVEDWAGDAYDEAKEWVGDTWDDFADSIKFW